MTGDSHNFLRKDEDYLRRLQLIKKLKLKQGKFNLDIITASQKIKRNNQYKNTYGQLTDDEALRVKLPSKVEVQNDNLKQLVTQELGKQAGKTAIQNFFQTQTFNENTVQTRGELQEKQSRDQQEVNKIIDYAWKQLQVLESERNKVASNSQGRLHSLDSLTKGRIIVKFMSQRANPTLNRYYQQTLAVQRMKEEEERQQRRLDDRKQKEIERNQYLSLTNKVQESAANGTIQETTENSLEEYNERTFDIEIDSNSKKLKAIQMTPTSSVHISKIVEIPSLASTSLVPTINLRQSQDNSHRKGSAQSKLMCPTHHKRVSLLTSPSHVQVGSRQLNTPKSYSKRLLYSSKTPNQISSALSSDINFEMQQYAASSKLKREKQEETLSIMSIYEPTSSKKTLSYHNIRPCDLKTQGGNFILPLSPQKLNPESHELATVMELIQKSTMMMNRTEKDKQMSSQPMTERQTEKQKMTQLIKANTSKNPKLSFNCTCDCYQRQLQRKLQTNRVKQATDSSTAEQSQQQ